MQLGGLGFGGLTLSNLMSAEHAGVGRWWPGHGTGHRREFTETPFDDPVGRPIPMLGTGQPIRGLIESPHGVTSAVGPCCSSCQAQRPSRFSRPGACPGDREASDARQVSCWANSSVPQRPVDRSPDSAVSPPGHGFRPTEATLHRPVVSNSETSTPMSTSTCRRRRRAPWKPSCGSRCISRRSRR